MVHQLLARPVPAFLDLREDLKTAPLCQVGDQMLFEPVNVSCREGRSRFENLLKFLGDEGILGPKIVIVQVGASVQGNAVRFLVESGVDVLKVQFVSRSLDGGVQTFS